jgi:hypothetical protein
VRASEKLVHAAARTDLFARRTAFACRGPNAGAGMLVMIFHAQQRNGTLSSSPKQYSSVVHAASGFSPRASACAALLKFALFPGFARSRTRCRLRRLRRTEGWLAQAAPG